jgi:arsenate reductase
MTSDFPITIYHNPGCGTSRNTLAMIKAGGHDPIINEYVKTGWTRVQLENLLKEMNLKPRDILREKGTPAVELGLLDPSASDDRILDEMVKHPILVNRPIVTTPKGTRLCRPSELVLELLSNSDIGTFTKEDGEIVPRVLRE